jgi:hypothetical protein
MIAPSRYPDRMIRYQRDPSVLHSTIDGDVVALSVDKGECISMPGVSAFLWHLLEVPRSIDELTERTTEEFEVSAERCRADLAEVLGEMEKAGIVKRT